MMYDCRVGCFMDSSLKGAVKKFVKQIIDNNRRSIHHTSPTSHMSLVALCLFFVVRLALRVLSGYEHSQIRLDAVAVRCGAVGAVGSA